MSIKLRVPLDGLLTDQTEHYILFHRDTNRTLIYLATDSDTIELTPTDIRILMSRLHNALRLTVEMEKHDEEVRLSNKAQDIIKAATLMRESREVHISTPVEPEPGDWKGFPRTGGYPSEEIRRHLTDIASILEI